MSRRRNTKTFTKAERAEMCRLSRNSKRRRQYQEKLRKQFFAEYSRICATYQCYVSGNLQIIRKAQHGANPTIKAHLKRLNPEGE